MRRKKMSSYRAIALYNYIVAEWSSKEKHIFILSDAGKPIYSHHGDEDELSSLMAVMQVIYPKECLAIE